MKDIILIWPENTLAYVFSIGSVFLFAAFFIFLAIKIFTESEEEKKKDWVKIYNWAIKRKLTSDEMSILEIFFNEQKKSLKKGIVTSKKLFRENLASYLLQAETSVKIKVNILGKLFPEIEANAELVSIDGVASGEFCFVEQDELTLFCRVVSNNDNVIRLKCQDHSASQLISENNSSIYLYRYGIGGYNLPGKASADKDKTLTFIPAGQINLTDVIHLMAEIELGFEITPFPEIYLREKILQEAELKEIPPPDLRLRLYGETIKISDRAIMFRLIYRGPEQEDPVIQHLKHSVDVDNTLLFDDVIFHRQPLWAAKILFTGGFLLECKGRIIPDKRHKGYLYFRYVELDPKSTTFLLEEIKRAGAMREKLI